MILIPGTRLQVRFQTMALGGRAKGTPIDQPPGKYAVFSELAAPGDCAHVEVTRSVKRYIEADLIELVEAGPDRVAPACPDFGQCGGCNWQHLNYQRQLVEKAEILKYMLSRNGLGEGLEIRCVPADSPHYYRFRADFSFLRRGAGLIGGFLKRRSHQIQDLSRCLLLTAPLCDGIVRLKKALHPLVSDVPEDRIFMVRALQDPLSGRIFIQPLKKDLLLKELLETYELVGEDLIPAENPTCEFEVDGIRLQFDPFCFTQVNLPTNRLLVQEAIDALELEPEDEVLELYAGIGNFTFPVAKRVMKVAAVESADDSYRFSVANGRNAGISNVDHIKTDAEKACRKLSRRGNMFRKVLVDPPRSGMGSSAVNALCDLEPERIVSISCHPDTLAKDLKRFAFRGYRVESIQGFDMFPQTFHLETLTLLKRV